MRLIRYVQTEQAPTRALLRSRPRLEVLRPPDMDGYGWMDQSINIRGGAPLGVIWGGQALSLAPLFLSPSVVGYDGTESAYH